MARIAGVDLPKDKRIDIGLTYVYGIGRVAAQAILKKAGVDGSIRVKDVSEDKIVKIREVIERDYGPPTGSDPDGLEIQLRTH